VIVVADTSVLLNLCHVGQIEILSRLFRDVVIPPEVAAEFARLSAQVPRFLGLTLPPWIRQQVAGHVPPVVRSAAPTSREQVNRPPRSRGTLFKS
jgi:hypothetical protein